MKKPITSLLSNYYRFITFSICFLVLPIHALSAEEVIVVYPTGIYGPDVNNVQAAIDQVSASEVGGIIELKSRNVDGEPTAFNFGTTTVDPMSRRFVTIEEGQVGPIEIRGEYDDEDDDDDNSEELDIDDSTEEPQTTILGGYAPIRMWGGGELTIRNIRFQDAYWWAIFAGSSDSLTIEGNVIVDAFGPPDEYQTFGMGINGIDYNQPSITGRVTIRDNVIDGLYGNYSYGLWIGATNAELILNNNKISGVNTGIHVRNYAQVVRIKGNNISNYISAPDKISVGIRVDCCGIAGSPAVTIEENQIESRADTLLSLAGGIYINSTDRWVTDSEMTNALIKQNSIMLTDGYTGISAEAYLIYDGTARVVRSSIVDNRVSGNGFGGIDLWGGSTTTELSRNRVLRNDLHDLDTEDLYGIGIEVGDIALRDFTRNNLVVAYPGDVVIDEGENNRVIILPLDDEDNDALGRRGGGVGGQGQASNAQLKTLPTAIGYAKYMSKDGNHNDSYADVVCPRDG